MTFAEKLRMFTAGKDRAALCKAAGIRETAITDYIAKGNLPRVDKAIRIAHLLGVPVEWLFDESRGIELSESPKHAA